MLTIAIAVYFSFILLAEIDRKRHQVDVTAVYEAELAKLAASL